VRWRALVSDDRRDDKPPDYVVLYSFGLPRTAARAVVTMCYLDWR
jgi:hypothetical protein